MSTRKSVKIILIVWAIIVALYGVTRFYQIKWNGTTSLPQKLWLIYVGDHDLKQGDYVMFKFHDYRMSNPADYLYVIKQIDGVPGDVVTVKEWKGRDVSVPMPNKTSYLYVLPSGGAYPTYDTLSGYHFTPITTENMKIPNGCYFVHGLQHPSFDSRYKEFGLVCENQIYGKADPIF